MTEWELDAVGQADLVRRGEVSPAELVEAAIARIEQLNPVLNAVIRTRFDLARDEARGDLPDGPFRGVPLLLKDYGADIAGEPVGCGLTALQDVPAPTTSYIAEQFRAAGFIVLGRTNVPEMATTVTTEPAALSPTRNPWDPGRSAGGSSGGSGAAVASGMVAVAHGSDGGGSIRIPASECGLVGLKPSRGRISHGPSAGEAWAGASTDGVLTRTVRDAAAVLDVISAPQPGDPYVAPPFARPLAAEVGTPPGRLRIGYLDRPGGERYLDDPECRVAVAAAVEALTTLGHSVEDGGPEALWERPFGRAFATVVAADTEASFRAYERMLGRPIGSDEIEPRNLAYRQRGSALSAADYLETRRWVAGWARRVATWWQDHDVLLTPTLGAPPPELGWFTAGGPDEEGRRIAALMPYTPQFNLTGQPAISLPLHRTPEGLPVGVQLVAAYGREGLLVRLAAQLEAAVGWPGPADIHPSG